MNAVTLELLVKRYYSDFPDYNTLSTSQKDGIGFLLHNDLIVNDDGRYEITDKGREHVRGLLMVPFPDKKWISPAREAKHPLMLQE